MTDRELLQQALEALETCSEDEWYNDDDFGMVQVYDEEKITEAITALRERLAQPETGREWVGLTEEEIRNLWDGHVVPVFGKNGINPIVFARAIEAKLKEKNQ